MRAAALITLALISNFSPLKAQGLETVEIIPQTLTPGVHVLFGAGGNIGVSTGTDGTLLIDDQFAPLSGKIIAAVGKLTTHPVQFILNTHWHGDHTGGNENFGRTGTIIIAQDNVRTRMASDQFIAAMKTTVKAAPSAALPVITFDNSTTLHINDEDIRAVHVAPAHTDGDSLILFTKANVIHMGDTYFASGYPFVDRSSGGDVRGVVAAVNKGLELGNDQTRYIPGHGPVGDRAALIEYRAMLSTIIGNVVTLMARKMDVEAVVAAKPSAAFDAKWGGGFIKADVFVRTVFACLDVPKKPK